MAFLVLHSDRSCFLVWVARIRSLQSRPKRKPSLHQGIGLGWSIPLNCWYCNADLQLGVSTDSILPVVHPDLMRISSDSTTAMKGWGTPRVPGILSASLVILALFLYYEHRREVRSLAVLMPLSMWRNSKAKLPAVMLMVFFGWYASCSIPSVPKDDMFHRFSFNCLIYWMTL